MSDDETRRPGVEGASGERVETPVTRAEEPAAAARRPSDVTRPDPTTRSHPEHDRLLVAASVAGDLEDADAAARARQQLDACAECAGLASELAALISAVGALPAPARPRDFRITAQQAEAVERHGLRRLLPAWRPGLAFARPLGAALTTVGVAGLLFASLVGGPIGAFLPHATSAERTAGGSDYAASFTPEQAGGNGSQDTGSKGGQVLVPSPASSPAAAPSAAASPGSGQDSSAAQSPLPSGAVPLAASPSPAAGPSTPPGAPSLSPVAAPSTPPGAPSTPPSTPSATPAPSANADTSGKTAGETKPGGGVPLLPAASLAAVLVGIGLLGADRLVRRR